MIVEIINGVPTLRISAESYAESIALRLWRETFVKNSGDIDPAGLEIAGYDTGGLPPKT